MPSVHQQRFTELCSEPERTDVCIFEQKRGVFFFVFQIHSLNIEIGLLGGQGMGTGVCTADAGCGGGGGVSLNPSFGVKRCPQTPRKCE